MNVSLLLVWVEVEIQISCDPVWQGGMIMSAFVLSMETIVTLTPQIVIHASWMLETKPVPLRCNPNPPLFPPEVRFKLVRVRGKLNATTAGELGTIPT